MRVRRPRQRIAPYSTIAAEDVSLYRWACPTCAVGGVIPGTHKDSGDVIATRARLAHARKSPTCVWSDEDVTICRLNH